MLKQHFILDIKSFWVGLYEFLYSLLSNTEINMYLLSVRYVGLETN